MGTDALWADLRGQLLYGLIALGGAALLPGGSLAQKLRLGPGRLDAARVALAALGFLALSHALHGLVVRLGWLEGSSLAELERRAREAGPGHVALVLLALGLAPALGEELLFRGFLLQLLSRRWPGAPAALGSAALFGAAHLDPVQGGAAFALGAWLAALTVRAGSLRPAVLCHALNNSLAAAGALGALPELGEVGASWQIAAGLAVAAGCSLAFLRPRRRLQAEAPPADAEGIPRGPHEDERSGPDRR
jgi:membrane protease YdiL (CAAX protease family)